MVPELVHLKCSAWTPLDLGLDPCTAAEPCPFWWLCQSLACWAGLRRSMLQAGARPGVSMEESGASAQVGPGPTCSPGPCAPCPGPTASSLLGSLPTCHGLSVSPSGVTQEAPWTRSLCSPQACARPSRERGHPCTPETSQPRLSPTAVATTVGWAGVGEEPHYGSPAGRRHQGHS